MTTTPTGADTAADDVTSGQGPSVAPEPYVLGAAEGPLDADELRRIDAWWRAANYLAVGQIYLITNPLLREPLVAEHVKPRLLGHFGTVPGLNLLWAHLNRAIRARDLDAVFVAGPGHGGPGPNACAWLEGTTSELVSDVTRDADGMAALFRRFSFPGGVPSHCAPETPGSFHEGGELGYSLLHAYGAALDNPDLVVACVVGDGEAETGPLATSLALQPVHRPGSRRRGAARAAPQRLQDRQPDAAGAARRGRAALADAGLRLRPDRRGGRRSRRRSTRTSRPRSTRCLDAIASIQARARARRRRRRRRQRQRGARLADDRAAHAEGMDRARPSSTASRWRAPSAPTRCRCRRRGTTTSTAACSRRGCGRTGPRSSSTTTAARSTSSWRCRPSAIGG